MKKRHIISKPTSIAALTFEELYDEISNDWQLKAARLQARRWRNMRLMTRHQK